MGRLGSTAARLTLAALALLGTGAAGAAHISLAPEVRQLVEPPATAPAQVRLATFNVHYALDPEQLARSLRDNAKLRAADALLLQEIEDHPGEGASRAHKLAQALRLNFVYAPARAKEDASGTHGLAILSRFPIREVKVIPLPTYDLRYNTRRRIALAATLDIGGEPLRLYNVHLDTRINAAERLRQLQPVLDDARSRASETVVAGDFNTNPFRWAGNVVPVFRSDQAGALDEFMRQQGFETAFARSGPTHQKGLLRFRLDSIYTRACRVAGFGIERSLKASDHAPLWVDLAWPQAAGAEKNR